MRQHCTDGSFRFCRWRTHTEAFREDSGPEALSTQGQYCALHVFYAIVQPLAGELSAHCCRTLTMTRYTGQCPPRRSLLNRNAHEFVRIFTSILLYCRHDTGINDFWMVNKGWTGPVTQSPARAWHFYKKSSREPAL